MIEPSAVTASQLRAWANVPQELAEMLCAFAEREFISVRRLRGDSKARDLILARKRFVSLADACGYSSASIGRALNRDHTTVLHHLKAAA